MKITYLSSNKLIQIKINNNNNHINSKFNYNNNNNNNKNNFLQNNNYSPKISKINSFNKLLNSGFTNTKKINQ